MYKGSVSHADRMDGYTRLIEVPFVNDRNMSNKLTYKKLDTLHKRGQVEWIVCAMSAKMRRK